MRILHDIESGDLHLSPGKTIYDYILDYQKRECDQQTYTLAEATGLNINKLQELISIDTNEQNINEQGRFDALILTLDKAKTVDFLKKVTGQDVPKRFVITNMSSILRRFILDPSDRAKIIYAYQNADSLLDVNIPEELPEEESSTEPTPEADNKLSDAEKRLAVRNLVVKDLRGIHFMPPSQEVVNAFFKIVNIPSLPQLDGIAIDMYDAFDELFARKNVNFVKKHVCSGNLLVRFEVYLKKLYYLLNDAEVPAKPGETKVTLSNAIYQFDCLKTLKFRSEPKYKTLSGYLELIKSCRNTEDGNGAHFSHFVSEEELDSNIKAIVTMYMYVTGMCLKDLKYKFSDVLDGIEGQDNISDDAIEE